MIEGFWSKPPDCGSNREQDPLGLSSVHEAAADVLLPLLSGRTRNAEEYLWVLVGLRWAASQATTEIEIWAKFEIFEKALKLHWYDKGRRSRFAGVDAVGNHYLAHRTDLDFKLISNQRSQGLLGAYLRSLRNAGLVKPGALALTDAGRSLIDRVVFQWAGKISGYGWLARTFSRAQEGFSRRAKVELGGYLFDPDNMRDVASSITALGQRPSWRKTASELAPSDKKRPLAEIGNDLANFSKRATETFWSALELSERSLPVVQPGRLHQRGWREIVFHSPTMQNFREPFDEFLSEIGRNSRRAFIQLHAAVWARRGHPRPWIRLNNGKIQVRPDIAIKVPPPEADWDLRWTVAHGLIQQTGWKPK